MTYHFCVPSWAPCLHLTTLYSHAKFTCDASIDIDGHHPERRWGHTTALAGQDGQAQARHGGVAPPSRPGVALGTGRPRRCPRAPWLKRRGADPAGRRPRPRRHDLNGRQNCTRRRWTWIMISGRCVRKRDLIHSKQRQKKPLKCE